MTDTDRKMSMAQQIGELKGVQTQVVDRLDKHGTVLEMLASGQAEIKAVIEEGQKAITERCARHGADIARAHQKIEAHIANHAAINKGVLGSLLRTILTVAGSVGAALLIASLAGCVRERSTVTAEKGKTRVVGEITNPSPSGPPVLKFDLLSASEGHIEEDSTERTSADLEGVGKTLGSLVMGAASGGGWGFLADYAGEGILGLLLAYFGVKKGRTLLKPKDKKDEGGQHNDG